MKSARQIPSPKTYGPLGSLPLINKEKMMQSFMKLADEYGPIFQFQFPGRVSTIVSSHELVSEVSDEKRFDKTIGPALQNVRAFGGDGLFTSETSEPNWKKAHNILLPSFSQQAMKGYHDKMADIAVQLVQKWSRLNENESIEVTDDMTRLTLDTIGLCGFNYRFNSYYREELHPFVQSMVNGLDEAMSQLQRFGLQDKLMMKKKREFQQDIESMFSLVDQLIADRKAQGDQGEDDLLSHMLTGRDPETGDKLSDENIRYQILTFLIAGHETTSGLLSFTLYYLMKNPEVLKKAYAEVDEVLGDAGVPSYKQTKQLKYVRMILNESLRLWPTAPAFGLHAKEDTMIGGDIPIEKGQKVMVLLPQLHRDPAVWGEDVEAFKPERFEDMKSIPQHAFKPFGNGQRACIGQQFALHEATLVLGMLLQHFEFVDHTNYQLDVKETLTLKPEGMTMKVKPRHQKMTFAMTAPSENEGEKEKKKKASAPKHDTPLLVLYGSNLGTAKGVARELAEIGEAKGFSSNVASLDEYAGLMPLEGAVIIVSASYNGNPPDNAHEFVNWLDQAGENELQGVHFTVFGCGDRNWANTYQDVPKWMDEQMVAKGATRVAERGEGDASDDFEGQYESWEEGIWSELADAFGLDINGDEVPTTNALTVEFVRSMEATPLAKDHKAFTARVVHSCELQGEASERSTRHLDIQLPSGVTYKEGDHLGIIPQNRDKLVNRVLDRFHLDGDLYMVLSGSSGKSAHLPLDHPVRVKDLMKHYVELQEPATRAQIRELAQATTCPPHKVELEDLLRDEVYKIEVLGKRTTMLELLEKYPACELSFDRFVALLPPLKARYYSISSSPAAQEGMPSITVGVVRGEAWSGNGEYNGVASTYLASLEEGDEVACFIHTPQSNFQLPESSDSPMILIGPGTGVAPFRGFLQARQALADAGEKLGEAHLYFGCRRPEEDYLYQDEFEAFQDQGLVTLHLAFSRLEGEEKTYVQHLVRDDAWQVIDLLNRGARLYVCGDGSQMAPAVEEVLLESYADIKNVSREGAVEWLNDLQQKGIYAKDVWSG